MIIMTSEMPITANAFDALTATTGVSFVTVPAVIASMPCVLTRTCGFTTYDFTFVILTPFPLVEYYTKSKVTEAQL